METGRGDEWPQAAGVKHGELIPWQVIAAGDPDGIGNPAGRLNVHVCDALTAPHALLEMARRVTGGTIIGAYVRSRDLNYVLKRFNQPLPLAGRIDQGLCSHPGTSVCFFSIRKSTQRL